MYKLTVVLGLMLGAWLVRGPVASADPDPDPTGDTKACYDSCDRQLYSCYDSCFDTGIAFQICQMGCDMAHDMCIPHCLPKPPGAPHPPPICLTDADCAAGTHCAGGICIVNTGGGGSGPKQGPGEDCTEDPDELCPEEPPVED